MKRAVAAILVLLAMVISPSFISAAGVIDEQYSLSYLNPADSKGKKAIIFEESVDTLRVPSYLFSYEILPSGIASVISACTGLNDPACASADFVKYYAQMPPCKTSTEVDCIESIYALAPGSPARIKGIYNESMPDAVALPYKADVANGLPQGSVSGVWEIPNVIHGGGATTYAAIVSQVGSLKRSGTTWIAQPAGSDPLGQGDGDFRAAIYPVNVVRDSGYQSRVLELASQPGGIKRWSTGTPSQPNHSICALVTKGACAQRQSFPDGIKFGMVLRFSKAINGWIHGRIDSPEIDYELTSYGTRVDIKGSSTRVPILAGYASMKDFSADDLKRFPGLAIEEQGIVIQNSSGDRAIEQLNIWAKVLEDKAAANPTQWVFYNLMQKDLAPSGSCITDSKTLAGLVTTNSTTYTASPPIFNQSTGTLDYKVASPHFLADGKIFQGKYDLYIDSKVARCIYKFSNAPISASVSITSADGGQQSVATTVVSEKSGWLHLSAAGFTFSSPTLKVKLTQDVNAIAPSPSPSPSPSPAAGDDLISQKVSAPVEKKLTITCVKGKVTKKVSAVAPKCPAGYKKKA
jgi:hypothetical protein